MFGRVSLASIATNSREIDSICKNLSSHQIQIEGGGVPLLIRSQGEGEVCRWMKSWSANEERLDSFDDDSSSCPHKRSFVSENRWGKETLRKLVRNLDSKKADFFSTLKFKSL